MKGKALKEAVRRQFQKPEQIQAKDALEGEKYVSKTGTMVVEIVSKGPDAITLKCYSEYGDEIVTDVSPSYLLTKDKTKEELLMSKHTKGKAKVNKMKAAKVARTAKTEGGTAVMDRPKKTRGEKDPRTGFGTGTTAHLVGNIMLKIGVANKEKCVTAIEAEFKKATLYPGKELYWARAWFHNHVAKKPDIYRA